MACLSGLISVNGTTTYTLESVGLGLQTLNDVAGNQYTDGEDLGNDKIAFAEKVLFDEFRNHLQPYLKASTVLNGQRLGYLKDKVATSEASTKKGIKIELTNPNAFVNIYVSSIGLIVDTTGDYNVQVWDTVQAKLLDTIAISAVANELTVVSVDKEYQSLRQDTHLAFIYDPNGASSQQTLVNENGCTSCSRGIYKRNAYLISNAISISSSSNVNDSNLDYASETGGLTIDYNIQCNTDSWLCTMKNLLALPLIYRSAEEIAHYVLQSSGRLNSETLITDWENKLTHYQTKYKETMDSLLKNIDTPNDGVCFYCKKGIKTVITV
jgi:hypothetical protein